MASIPCDHYREITKQLSAAVGRPRFSICREFYQRCMGTHKILEVISIRTRFTLAEGECLKTAHHRTSHCTSPHITPHITTHQLHITRNQDIEA